MSVQRHALPSGPGSWARFLGPARCGPPDAVKAWIVRLYNRIGRPRPSSTHDRPRDMTDFDRSMRGTLGSGASRILNVAQTTRRLEVAADAAGGGPDRKSTRLNSSP